MNKIIWTNKGKKGKKPKFLHISTILTKKVQILAFVMDFLSQYYKNLRVNFLSLASVNKINAPETMHFIRV